MTNNIFRAILIQSIEINMRKGKVKKSFYSLYIYIYNTHSTQLINKAHTLANDPYRIQNDYTYRRGRPPTFSALF